MAVLLQNTAAGFIDGVTPTTSGATGGSSGDAFLTPVKGASSVLEGSSAHPIQGSMGVHFVTAGTEGSYLAWTPSGEAQDSYAARCGIIVNSTGAVTSEQSVIQIRSGSGAMATLVIDPDAGTGGTADRFKLLNAVGADGATGAVDIPWAFTNKIFVELWVTKGTTTSNGNAQFRWWVGTTLQETITTKAASNYNTGTAQATTVRFGRSTTPSTQFEYWMGAFALQTAASGYVGLPSATAVALNITQGVKYYIDASPSVAGGGGALTYSITQDAGPTVVPDQIALGVWVVEQDPTNELEYTVEVDEAANGSDSAVVTVPPLATGTAGGGQSEELLYSGSVWA